MVGTYRHTRRSPLAGLYTVPSVVSPLVLLRRSRHLEESSLSTHEYPSEVKVPGSDLV